MTSDILKCAAEVSARARVYSIIAGDRAINLGELLTDMAAEIAECDAELRRLTARAEAAEAQVANAGAVMVEAALRLPAYDSDGDPAGQFDHHVFVRRDDLRALSTLSPIAAAARVLLAQTEAANDPEIGPWLRALEQDAKPPTEYERKVAQMKKDFPNGI